MKIRGPATATLDHVLTHLGQYSPHPRFAAEMVPALWDAALRYGIDPVVMVAQAGHETGWGHYRGLVPPHFHNTAGIKLRDLSSFPNSEVTAAHAVFPDWATGARAHAQHLMAYTQTAVTDPIVDPRWVWVYGRKPAITDVEQLGGNWAPNPNYGNLVSATASKLSEGAVMVAYMPGFEWVGGPRSEGSTYIDGVPWRICLHTTETPPISRGGNPRYMAATHNTPPHIWYDHEADQGWQSVTLDRGAFALWNGGNPQTNRARCLQVELVGYAEEAAGWPDEWLARIARRVIQPLVDFAVSQGGAIDLSDAAVPLPGAIPGSASEYAPQRLSASQWLNGPIGLVSHRHVPTNDHWDAGGLNTRRIRDLVLGAGGGTGVDDMFSDQDRAVLNHLHAIMNDGNRWASWYDSSMKGRSAAAQISFVSDARNGAIYLVHGTAWKWWIRDGNTLAAFRNHWAVMGADTTIYPWGPEHVDAVPSADELVGKVDELIKLARGEQQPPTTVVEKVIDVEGSLAAATVQQLLAEITKRFSALAPPSVAAFTASTGQLVQSAADVTSLLEETPPPKAE